MNVSIPYMLINGHPVDLNPNINHVYSDEFKHVVIHYYISARTDPRYIDVPITVAGKIFMKALFSRDIVPNWTLFGGTFVFYSDGGTIPISNKRAIELLVERFSYQRHVINWQRAGYGYLRRIIFAKGSSDSLVMSDGSEVLNEETPLFPPTLYVDSNNRCHKPNDSDSSRNIYNQKRVTCDRRKFSKRNNQYVNGALYDHIPSSCGQIVPDNRSNSRIVLKVNFDRNNSSRIVITKYHHERLTRINRLMPRFHDGFHSISIGKEEIECNSRIKCVQGLKFLI